MKIQINSSTKLIAIQQAFQDYFPFLKLEFYGKGHQPGEGNSNATHLNLQYSFKELNIDLNNFDWEFESSNTVSELEESFYNKTGISAQVFRKSGISWLQTIVTDSWTLEQQNTRGKESTQELPKEEQEDYHEQE